MMSMATVQGVVAIIALMGAWGVWKTAIRAAFRHLVLSVRDDVWMTLWRSGAALDAPDHMEFREFANAFARFAHHFSNLGLLPVVLVAPLSPPQRTSKADRFAGERQTIIRLVGVCVVLVAPLPVAVLLGRALIAAARRPNPAEQVAHAPDVSVQTLTDIGADWMPHRELATAP